MNRGKIATVTALAALALTGVLASSAQGSFHVMKIKEITGDNGTNGSYIELQMYDPGQNSVAGHNITIWNATGSILGNPVPVVSIPLMGPNPTNGENQRTVLIGDTDVAGRDFTVDFTPYLDTTAGMNVAAAGAACFEAIPVDCVSWGGGAFSGAGNLPDNTQPIGTALGVGVLSFRRNIAGGTCATALDAADDTNNAANDFTNGASSPTPNSALPTEQLCVTPNPTPNLSSNAKAKKCKKKKKGKGKASPAAKKKCKKKKK